jgi:3-dehydroquinate synthase
MQTHRIALGERSYDILVGSGILSQLGARVKETLSPSRAIVIADRHVADIYAERALTSLRNAELDADLLTFPPGEDSKSLQRLSELYDELLTRRLDRKSCLVALGGGVTGDLAGFAAATYMRGIPFVQVPTSLLAQVDSSSGGKTGINHPLGKNMIGAFHQPRLVLIDIDTLRTLPAEELHSGLAEVVKHGMIRDADYFEQVEKNTSGILALEAEIMERIVLGSCRIKGDVVSDDERESGVRAHLNFGHTFGHAYETLSHYEIRHGEAVAMGMIAACRLAERLGIADASIRERLAPVLTRLGLPTASPAFDAEDVFASMRGDKKTERDTLRVVLVSELGSARIVEAPDPDAVLAAIRETAAS